MATQQATSTGIGLRKVRAFLRDSDSLPEVPADVAVGDPYEGYVMDGALSLSVTLPEPNRVPARGDDRVYYTFNLPPTEGATGELRLTKLHMPFAAAIAGTKVFGSPPVRKIGTGTEKVGLEKQTIMYGCRQGIDSEYGSAYFGQPVWQTYILLNALNTLRPSTLEDQTVGEQLYSVTANDSTVDELGQTFTEAVNGFLQAPILVVITRNMFHMDVFLGDNAETEFTLTNTPSADTESTIMVSVDGVVLTPTGNWSHSAGVITFDAAPADGAKIVVEYEYE